MSETTIGDIGNYYGRFWAKEEHGKFYWSVENWDGNTWEEIPEYLYDALARYEAGRSPQA